MRKNKKDDFKTKVIVTIIGIIVLLTVAVFYYRFFVYEKKTVYSDKGITLSYENININGNMDKNLDCNIVSESLDGSLTFKENEVPIVGFKDYNAKAINKEVKITLYSIKDSDEYSKIAALTSIKTDNMKVVDNIKSKITKNPEDNRASYFDFGRTLKKGYYLAKYNIDEYCKDFYQLIQISNITSYVGNTERDILVWTMNPANDSPIKNAKVYLADKKTTTNNDGIAKFENLINVANTKIKYVKINNGDDELLVAVNDFNTENYYKGFIYTDRPLYKKTDTIKVWGFVSLKLFSDNIKDEFIVKLGDQNYAVKPDSDGMFTLDINLKNHVENSLDIELYYGDSKIAFAPISIQEYVKPKVEYKIETNKNNYYIGDLIAVSVKANYLTGEPYTGKTLYVGFNKKIYQCLLNTEGSCVVFIDTSNYKADPDYASDNIINDALYLSEDNLFNIEDYSYLEDLKDGSLLASTRISFLNRDIKLSVERKMIANDKYNFDFTVEKITIDNDKLVYKNINKNVDIKVTKIICKGSNVEYTRYNSNTKKEEKYYLYNPKCDLDSKNEAVKSYDVYIVNGKKEFSDLNYLSKLTKDDKYILIENYNIKFSTKDSKNNEIVINASTPWATIDNYYLSEETDTIGLTSFSPICYYNEDCEVYPTLAYKNLEKKYSIDNTIDTRLYSNDVTEKTNGKKLTYLFKDKILNTFFDKSEITFTKDYFPGVDIGGAFYNKDIKNINIVNRNYLDYKETDRKVNINLVTNNTLYEPNGDVTLDINVTDKDGKPVETNVLISVVDEAIFLIKNDRNEEINTIYDNKDINFYQYSTYLELPFAGGGVGATAGGNDITKVGDTVFFKNIKTDKNGTAKVTFKLNALETKFRITAIAVNPDLYYGTNSINIISKTKVLEEQVTEDNNQEQPTT